MRRVQSLDAVTQRSLVQTSRAPALLRRNAWLYLLSGLGGLAFALLFLIVDPRMWLAAAP